MKRSPFVVSLPLAAVLISCASRTNREVASAPPVPEPSSESTANAQSDDRSTQSSVAISDEIARACGLTQTETYFAFDSARIGARATTVLRKLADCFAKGPLAGRSMRLVGHADPRGDEEYNFVLGGRRADSVLGVLRQFGLPRDRASTSSRGEMDAAGTNEASWARDRRVDVMLGS